ncbi:MAG: amidohydrolase family protein [Clostridiales Family XIII bacterium]|nr:amidohydrolase family protein [Clostridiales Family XIII bacterium]
METHRYILKGNLLYSESPSVLRLIENGFLVCMDGFSAGAYEQLPAAFAGLPVVDYGDALILPGLVDLHVHAPQYTYRGIGLDLELLEWLKTYTYPEETKFSDLQYADAAYSQFVHALLKSPTTRASIFATVHVDATLLLMEKLEKSGLVCYVGKVNMDRNCASELMEGSAMLSTEATLAFVDEAKRRFVRTFPILTPRFIPACSDALMISLSEIQKRYSLPVQSHLSENKDEISWVRSLAPESKNYADAYARFHLFGGDVQTVMAHCVWSEEEEVALMKDRGVFVAHCPQSNMNVASGIAPIRKYLSRGLRLGLGTDVAGGSNLSVFRAMADAIQSSKLYYRHVDASAVPLTLAEAFYMGTKGGGMFFGKVGSFEPGYEFDALVMDDAGFGSVRSFSLHDRLSRLIYLPENAKIRAKYVKGTLLFSD